MDFLFRLALRGKNKAADDAPQAQEGAEMSPMAPAGVLTSAADLPSAAATLAEIFPEEIPSEENFDTGSPEEAEVQGSPADIPATPPTRDWSLEEKLASHREWVESKGATGKPADFAGAELEGAELIGVNLRFADLHDANLKGADMLLADLRDTCLTRANLEEACLVGTSLEGANLEGASLASAMGLVPRQFAGTNLHEASLPQQILRFDALREFERTSRMASRLLAAIMLLCLLCCLMVWKTKDLQLVANLAVVPYLHSAGAAVALPTVQFFSLLPVLLTILYLVFQFHLQRLWDAMLELPAVFPDGRKLGDFQRDGTGRRGPRMVLGLLRAHFRWMNRDAPSTRAIEKALSLLAAYWTVPATLVLFWARTLTLGDFHSTILHVVLVMTSTGVALYATTRVGRPEEAWTQRESILAPVLEELKRTKPAAFAIGLGAVLALLSMGTIIGIPQDSRRAPQYGAADIRRWAPRILWAVGYDPFADLTEAAISTKPVNWTGGDQEIPSVHGARMNSANLRYAQAYGVFLANAHLWRADFEGAFMPEADLRGADLGEGNLRSAELDGARMYRANLDRAQLDGANLARADLREANMSYDSLTNAILTDARLDGATLYGARLPSATLIRASLEKADLRGSHMEGANLDRADLGQAYLWSANLSGAQLKNARLGSALLIEVDLTGADLEGAQFPGGVLSSAILTGANLDGADLRGAFGLTANQVCSARTRTGALLDEALQTDVNAQCGGGAPLSPASTVHP
jgi:uncharacterized protein YjbI with pentapeptide repeats